MKEANLPEWATLVDKGRVAIQAVDMFPVVLEELWSDDNWNDSAICGDYQREAKDQYWLKVAANVAKMDIQTAIQGTEAMPEKGGALVISIKDRDKADNDGFSAWALANFPKGKDNAAKESKAHYRRIRNLLM